MTSPVSGKALADAELWGHVAHTSATLAIQAGVHAKLVSERLGHATVVFTLDVYAHAVPSMEETAAQKVADLFVP